MALELDRLTKTFPGGVQAVAGVSLVVPDGALVVLVGPSGCGKTTLLRLVAGLETPTAGRIVLSGRDLTDMPPANREVAMVFQDHALYPARTVYQNLAFPLRLRHLPAPEVDARVRGAAARLGLEDVLAARPGELSGGQRQRVALGRALVRRPALFLFDEPLSNVDAGLRRQLRQLIKQLQRESGITALHVTHDQEEALALADLLVVMDAGRLHQAGTPQEVYERPANRFVAGFVGPAMNFVEGRLAARDGSIFFEGPGATVDAGAALAPWAGQPVGLGFRPEAALVVATRGSPVGSAGLTLHGRVLLVEYLGDRVDVTLAGPQSSWTVRLGGATPLSLGQEVELVVPLERCHWFEPGPAGRRLPTSPA
jgi:sn-glycerol 3-phosphate transport system ATP-binding protein